MICNDEIMILSGGYGFLFLGDVVDDYIYSGKFSVVFVQLKVAFSCLNTGWYLGEVCK